MLDGIGFRAGECPLNKVDPPPAIQRLFPRARFYSSMVRTSEWHLNEIPWPVLVGSAYPWRYPAVHLSLRETHHSEFFRLLSGTWLATRSDGQELAEGLAALVFWHHSPPCSWLPSEVESDQVVVHCITGKAQLVLRAYFDVPGFIGESGTFSSAVIQFRQAPNYGMNPSAGERSPAEP